MTTIKFFKSSTRPASLEGAIWFNPTTRTINVCKSITNNSEADWEPYAGKLVDAGWNEAKNTLTIQKSDGSEVVLNFSDVAASSAVTAALNALKAELEGKINTTNSNVSKNAKDITANAEGIAANTQAIATEKTRAEGAEADLQSQITAMRAAYEKTDTELDGRIDTLEAQITGLSGTLHFRGVTDTAPVDPAQGDFYITTAGVEYIYDGTKWEKIGDTSAESAAIAELQNNVGENTQAITILNGTGTGSVAKAVADAKSELQGNIDAVDDKADENADYITALQSRAATIEEAATALTTRVATAEGEIDDLQEAVEALQGVQGDYVQNSAYTTKMQALDSKDNSLQAAINTLNGNNTTAGSVAKSVKDAIDALDATKGSTTVANDKHVAVQVVEENGLLTSVTVTEKDIASAAALSAVDTRLQVVEDKMPLLEWGTFED